MVFRLIAVALLASTAYAQPEQPGGVADSAAVALVRGYQAGVLDDESLQTLLALAVQEPGRLEALEVDPGALIREIARHELYRSCTVELPRTAFAKAMEAYRNGQQTVGDSLFNGAIETAQSNLQRADFYYSRGSSPYGGSGDFNRALEYFPNHGPSLYRRAGLIGDAVGRQQSTRGRAAYWCLADIYRNVAASSSDSRISSAARRAAAQYERSGPTREQYFLDPGWRPGQSVTASLGAYGSCTTRVR